ncbi:hypothetical protein GINT2_000195 [Glugoides intestinalis]
MATKLKRSCMRSFRIGMFKLKLKRNKNYEFKNTDSIYVREYDIPNEIKQEALETISTFYKRDSNGTESSNKKDQDQKLEVSPEPAQYQKLELEQKISYGEVYQKSFESLLITNDDDQCTSSLRDDENKLVFQNNNYENSINLSINGIIVNDACLDSKEIHDINEKRFKKNNFPKDLFLAAIDKTGKEVVDRKVEDRSELDDEIIKESNRPENKSNINEESNKEYKQLTFVDKDLNANPFFEHLIIDNLYQYQSVAHTKLVGLQESIIKMTSMLKTFDSRFSKLTESWSEKLEKTIKEKVKEKDEAFEKKCLEIEGVKQDNNNLLLKKVEESLSRMYLLKNSVSKANISFTALFSSVSNYIDNENIKNQQNEQKYKSKLSEMELIEKNHELLKAKSEMLEENIDYIYKQNEILKVEKTKFLIFVETTAAILKNLKKFIKDLSMAKTELSECLINKEASFFSKELEVKKELNELRKKALQTGCLLSSLDIKSVVSQVVNYIQKAENAHAAEKRAYETTNKNLVEEINNFKSELSDLKMKNDELTALNIEIKEDGSLKESYSKELEKSIDDLMKSNRFYENQLLAADEIIKTLKEVKSKSTVEFANEIDKIKKAFFKENGLLKLRIEELEADLLQKSFEGSKID